MPGAILADDPVTYTVVEIGSQRGQVKLVSSDGYTYVKKVFKKNIKFKISQNMSKDICIKKSKQIRSLMISNAPILIINIISIFLYQKFKYVIKTTA